LQRVSKPVAKNNVAAMQEVIELHRSAVSEIAANEEFAYLKRRSRESLGQRGRAGKKAWLSQRPGHRSRADGTISFLMDCDTTGIEPDIALVKYKLLAGGGMLKIVNQTVTPALEKLEYNSERSSGSSRTSTRSIPSRTWKIPTARRLLPG